MAVIQTGDELGTAILKVLGIDPKMVQSVSINLEANSVATVNVVRFLDKAEGNEVVKALEQYTLERKEDMLRLPVVSMGLDKVSGPDMTAVSVVNAGGWLAEGSTRLEMEPMEAARALVKKHGGG